MNKVQEFLKEAHLDNYWPAFEKDAITTIDRLLLISTKKAEEIFSKWGEQAEFFNKRKALEAKISQQDELVLNLEADNFGNCTVVDVVDADNIVKSPVRQSDKNIVFESASDSGINISDSETDVVTTEEKGKKRQLSELKSKQYPKRLALHVTRIQFEELNIEKEIRKHLKGDAVLIYYKNNGILNGEARGILVEILASCMIKINIKLTCPEPYFLSEGLYATPEELENTREVTLHVITIGAFIEDSAKKDDFTAVSAMLRQYLPEKDTPYILDIDLDFFSTKNPFKDIHERVNLYEKLAPLFTYKRAESNDPEMLKDSMIERNQQLSELKNLFGHLEEHRSLKGYDGPKASRYEAVDRLFQEVTSTYRDSEIDWMLVYNAGCTIDDTILPEHVTEPNDLDRLINGTFRLFLTALPTPPTIVTIARSSEDDYTPLENVDQIQVDVLDQLRERLGPEIDVKLIYQQNEEQQ